MWHENCKGIIQPAKSVTGLPYIRKTELSEGTWERTLRMRREKNPLIKGGNWVEVPKYQRITIQGGK